MIAHPARVTKPVDVADLKFAAARRVGSTPTPGTNAKGLATALGKDVRGLLLGWMRDPESNRAERICNPVHNRFAIAP